MQLQKPSQVWADIKRTTIPLVVSGLKLWPLAHCITYGLVPVENRLLWVDMVEIVWVTILATQAAASVESNEASEKQEWSEWELMSIFMQFSRISRVVITSFRSIRWSIREQDSRKHYLLCLLWYLSHSGELFPLNTMLQFVTTSSFVT